MKKFLSYFFLFILLVSTVLGIQIRQIKTIPLTFDTLREVHYTSMDISNTYRVLPTITSLDTTNNNILSTGCFQYPAINGSVGSVADFGYCNFTNAYSGLEKYSYASAPGVYSGGLYFKFNETYELKGNNVTAFFPYLIVNANAGFRLMLDDVIVSGCPTTQVSFVLALANETYEFTCDTTNVSFNGIVFDSYSNLHTSLLYAYVSNVTFDVNTGNNELPECDIDLTPAVSCLSEGVSTLNVNMNCSDVEGDTIYYFQGLGGGFNYTREVRFNDYQCGALNLICFNFPDTDVFFNDFLTTNETCELNYNSYNDNTKHQIVLGYDSTLYESQVLEVNGYCEGEDKSLYFNTKKVSSMGNIHFEIVSFEDGDEVNLSLLTGSLQEYANFNLRKNSTGVYVSLINDSVFVPMYNFTDMAGRFTIYFSNTADNSIWYSQTYYSESGTTLDTYAEGNVSLVPSVPYFSVVGITPKIDTLFHIPYIGFALVSYSLNFTTDEPTSLTKNRAGNFNQVFYVSDSVHQPDEYAIYNEWIRVYEQDSPYCIALNTTFYETVDILIGDAGESYYSTLGLNEKLDGFLYLLFFGLSTFFIVVFFKLSQTIRFSISIMLSAGICLIASWFTHREIAGVVFILLFSLGLGIALLTKGEY